MSSFLFQVILKVMKVRNSLLILIFLVSFSFFSCDTLFDILGLAGSGDALFTNAEAVEAMKSALNIGAKDSSTALSQEDAYYKSALKIPLPDEVDNAIKTLTNIPAVGYLLGDLSGELVEDVVLSINRSAEAAAKEIVPIFSNAITEMTVQDGITIVTGERNAATVYLKDKTYSQLMNSYQPRMDKVLKQDLIGDVSANDAWENLTSKYNGVIDTINNTYLLSAAVKASGYTLPEKINTDLPEYVTGKALDGVFVKVGEEEGKIRDNPWGYASNIIEKVFGAVKNNFK